MKYRNTLTGTIIDTPCTLMGANLEVIPEAPNSLHVGNKSGTEDAMQETTKKSTTNKGKKTK